jgi:predicted DNA-binding transcriptional regulator YafY
MDQTERLLDLLGLLLDASTPVTFDHIRLELRDAYTQGDIDSAKRMFERDKDTLRELGVPIETTSKDEWTDENNAYFIPKDKFYLPEIRFTPDEISALLVAATSAGEDDFAERGLRKLLYGAEAALLRGRDDPLLAGGPDLSGDNLAAVADAIAERRQVTFDYVTSAGDPSERHVDPYSLVWRSGHYYLVGLDRDRNDIRSFRISRIASDVRLEGTASAPPDGFIGRNHVTGSSRGLEGSEPIPTRIAFTDRVSWWATADMQGVEKVATAHGWDETLVPGSLDGSFVSWILSFGPDARVIEPEALRRAVVSRLEAVLGNL